MAAPQLRARMFTLLALGAVGLGSACYSTVPHRAQVATMATARDCAAAINDVFESSGFTQLPPTQNLSMLFTARMSGPYTSFLRSGAGVGVTIDAQSEEVGACHVTLEALSPDSTCVDEHVLVSCGGPGGTTQMNPMTGDSFGGPGPNRASTFGPCPIVRPVMCQLSYAPGADNDAAVDELARRLKMAFVKVD